MDAGVSDSHQTEANLVQFKYLQPVITQYFASNKSEIWS